jgi:type IV secretion system protein VirB9
MHALVWTLSLSLSIAGLAGCATAGTAPRPPVEPRFAPAQRQMPVASTVTVRPLDTAVVPAGLILSMPVPQVTPVATGSAKPLDRIAAANKAAVQEPRADGFINAIQVFPYWAGALYRVYTAPDRVTDIALQGGEQLIAISAGDTTRWTIGNTHSGTGTDQTVHILVKPQLSGLATNLVIASDRRTYHLQVESTPATAMAAISWRYPQDELLAVQATAKAQAVKAPTADGIALEDLHFGYAITGSAPAWRPVRAFDDGVRVYIEFPKTLEAAEMPPLFLAGPDGKAELTNYRVSRNFYIVDRLFQVAELRLGGKPQAIVRITATTAFGGRHD